MLCGISSLGWVQFLKKPTVGPAFLLGLILAQNIYNCPGFNCLIFKSIKIDDSRFQP